MALHGADVSNWKSRADMGKVRDFGIVQTTWGTGYSNNVNLVNGVSTIADRQIQQLLGAGKAMAFMHYYQGGGVDAEAAFFVEHNRGYIGKGIPMIDWEAGDNPNFGNAGVFEAMLVAFTNAIGGPGIVYYPGAQDAVLGPIAKRHNWGTCPASYADSNPTGYQDHPWNEDAYDCAMRQYSDNGDVGLGENVDLDIFYGDRAAWDRYVAGSTGGSKEPQHTTPAPAPKPQSATPNVHYGLHVLGGDWAGEVVNFGSGDNGFAGVPNHAHDMLYAWVDRGELRYSAHTQQDGWLPEINLGDMRDTVNKCAGVFGHAIDGVRFYYVTSNGETMRQAWYRSQTTARAGWLGVCCDDGKSIPGFDGFAGILGEPLDRLQLSINDHNPF